MKNLKNIKNRMNFKEIYEKNLMDYRNFSDN